MTTIWAALLLAAGARAQVVRSVEAAGAGRQYSINAVPALALSLEGTYKSVVVHPEDPQMVVKIFDGRYGSMPAEQKRELADVARLPPGITPAVRQAGTANGRPFVVVDRVDGLTLKRVTPIKLEETRKLFARLKKAGIKLSDVESLQKLQQNIMVGSTRGGDFRAWLVDPDLEPGTYKQAELAAFYDGLAARLERGR